MLYNKSTHISLAVISLLSALALTACGGGSDDDNQNTSSPLNATYYKIESHNFSDPDTSKRYADVKKITIENGKVIQEKIGREVGTGTADSWSNTQQSNNLILAENFSATENISSNSLMDTNNKKSIWHSDRISSVITDSTTNNTISQNTPIKHVDLSGKKVYDSNSKIDTELNNKNGSVSEVYPQGASCVGMSFESLQPADKVYIDLDTTSTRTYASFTEWQDKQKEHIKQQEAFQMIGDAEDIKVGSNNEYDAQIIKVKVNDLDDKVQMTFYYSAIKYQGKIYDTSGGFFPDVYPNTKIIVDPSSPLYDAVNCQYYNEVAKEYIIAQLKTLP